jgi:hypothetical protein
MSQIILEWDKSKRLYALPVVLFRKTDPMTIGGKSPYVDSQTIMYIDTGSNITSIREKEATELEIDLQSLENMPVAGSGGFTQTRIARNIEIITRNSQGNPVRVSIDQISIVPDFLKKKEQKSKGMYRQRGESEAQMVCLLGLDYIEKINGTLKLDLQNKSGSIEYNENNL